MKHPLRILAAGTAVAASALAGVTFASWSAGSAPQFTIASGSLNLSPAGDVMWFDASIAGQTVPIDPDTFLATSGDVLRAGQMFTTDAVGDNMNSRVSVDWTTAPDLPEGVTAEYRVTADGVAVGGYRPLGEPVTLEAAPAGTHQLLIDLVIQYGPDVEDNLSDTATPTDIGSLTVSLDQLRPTKDVS